MNVDLEVAEPYPHFVRDCFFSDEILADFHRNWPGLGYFKPEVPGNYICSLGQFQEGGFWKIFMVDAVPSIFFYVLVAFAPYIKARYPEEKRFSIFQATLMQSRGDYGGHDVHTHHYHDPTLIATILIYLDTTSDGHMGTTLLRTKAGLDEAKVAAQTLKWHDLTEKQEMVEYLPGRVFAFYDNPIAYHSVEPSLPGALFGRRILRFHLQADNSHCERLYGVDYDTYVKKRRIPTDDPQVIDWLRKDIEAMRNTPPMSHAERIAWVGTLSMKV